MKRQVWILKNELSNQEFSFLLTYFRMLVRMRYIRLPIQPADRRRISNGEIWRVIRCHVRRAHGCEKQLSSFGDKMQGKRAAYTNSTYLVTYTRERFHGNNLQHVPWTQRNCKSRHRTITSQQLLFSVHGKYTITSYNHTHGNTCELKMKWPSADESPICRSS